MFSRIVPEKKKFLDKMIPINFLNSNLLKKSTFRLNLSDILITNCYGLIFVGKELGLG